MKASIFAKYLDNLLKTYKFKEEEDKNKLVIRGKSEIKKIGFAVNTSWEVLKKAKKVDFLVVHHPTTKEIDQEQFVEKTHFFKENKTSYYVAHASLDANEEFGIAQTLAQELGVDIHGRFAKYCGADMGVFGTIKVSKDAFLKKCQKVLGLKPVVLESTKKMKKIAILPGNSGESVWVKEAIKNGCDTMVTGEQWLFTKMYAKEAKMNLVLGTHYATEVFGVKALMEKVKQELGVPVVFIDEENLG